MCFPLPLSLPPHANIRTFFFFPYFASLESFVTMSNDLPGMMIGTDSHTPNAGGLGKTLMSVEANE